MVTIKFIFDIASPNGYLCHKVIPDYEKKYSVRFDYEICLLGGIHKLSNNQPPMISNANIPNKFNYFDVEMGQDKMLNTPLVFLCSKDFSF